MEGKPNNCHYYSEGNVQLLVRNAIILDLRTAVPMKKAC